MEVIGNHRTKAALIIIIIIIITIIIIKPHTLPLCVNFQYKPRTLSTQFCNPDDAHLKLFHYDVNWSSDKNIPNFCSSL